MAKQELAAKRKRIDELDEQIQAFITERASCALEIAKIKGMMDTNGEFYRAEREAEVLRKVLARNQGPLSNEEMVRLFRELMSACLALQQPMKIAFLGPEGTFTQAAAFKHFGHSVTTVPLSAIDEIFREVESGGVHHGVVPVENSTEGVISYTLDMFINSPLRINGEVELRIHHHLLGVREDLGKIRSVYSHQQSLAQCREWLDANLSGVERISVSSNAEAARRARNEPQAAAIAGETAARLYDLHVLASNIEDEPDNTTRFLVIAHNGAQPSGDDKTTLILAAPNKPGALYRLLEIFARYDISMTRIESRPSRRGAWDYVFFIDIEGHVQDKPVAAALRLLKQEASMVKILGSYPKAVL